MSAVIQNICKNCGFEVCELRKKIAANGSRMVAWQCMQCGGAASHWLKQASLSNIESLPLWDSQISERYFEAKRKEREEQLFSAALEADGKTDAWWTNYNNYLRTPLWRSRRALVLQRAGGWCEGCRKLEATQVHHLTYAHVGNEFLWELVAICGECHERIHDDGSAL